MSRKNVRVNMPVNMPAETIELCEGIIEKNTALGAASVLNAFFDMPAFGTKTVDAKALRKRAKKDEGESQSKYNQCAVKCGIAAGQNKQSTGTLYVMVLSIRDFLLLKFRATPESLSMYGYNVVVTQTEGKRNVRVDIPDDNPKSLLDLCTLINEKHIADGATSILNDSEVDMTVFGTLLGDANVLLAASTALDATKQSQNNSALTIIGYGEGQTAETEGTLYYMATGIRDRLLNKHAGNEEKLSEYTFDVVISSSSAGNGDTPPVTPP
ncbi:MAG: hypothetical protein ABI855_08850 [Bacteroidota bacterium]